MNVLAIGAHPDDIEIFMFGFLKFVKTEEIKYLCYNCNRWCKRWKKIKRFDCEKIERNQKCIKKTMQTNVAWFS